MSSGEIGCHSRMWGVFRLKLLPIKWRLLIAGCIVSVISIVMLSVKGGRPFYLVLLAVGVGLVIVSSILLLRSRRG